MCLYFFIFFGIKKKLKKKLKKKKTFKKTNSKVGMGIFGNLLPNYCLFRSSIGFKNNESRKLGGGGGMKMNVKNKNMT